MLFEQDEIVVVIPEDIVHEVIEDVPEEFENKDETSETGQPDEGSQDPGSNDENDGIENPGRINIPKIPSVNPIIPALPFIPIIVIRDGDKDTDIQDKIDRVTQGDLPINVIGVSPGDGGDYKYTQVRLMALTDLELDNGGLGGQLTFGDPDDKYGGVFGQM